MERLREPNYTNVHKKGLMLFALYEIVHMVDLTVTYCVIFILCILNTFYGYSVSIQLYSHLYFVQTCTLFISIYKIIIGYYDFHVISYTIDTV